MTATTMYHGGNCTRAKGYLWVTADRDYAESFGAVEPVEVATSLRILDLSSVECDDETEMDVEAMQELLDDAGIAFDVTRLPVAEPQYVAYRIADQARAAGYDGIRIREWTYGVGCVASTMLLV